MPFLNTCQEVKKVAVLVYLKKLGKLIKGKTVNVKSQQFFVLFWLFIFFTANIFSKMLASRANITLIEMQKDSSAYRNLNFER